MGDLLVADLHSFYAFSIGGIGGVCGIFGNAALSFTPHTIRCRLSFACL
jgi:hypothetical protein